LRRVGPYAVHTTSVRPARTIVRRGSIQSFAVMSGFTKCSRDTAGRRGRRDTSRPGRLYWLAGTPIGDGELGRVRGAEGEPFLTGRRVRLASGAWCALEPGDRARCLRSRGRDTRRSLAHVWRRPDGQLVLLDFPWPALTGYGCLRASQPVGMLAAVSARAHGPTAEQPLRCRARRS
jgi:hypothetical protein